MAENKIDLRKRKREKFTKVTDLNSHKKLKKKEKAAVFYKHNMPALETIESSETKTRIKHIFNAFYYLIETDDVELFKYFINNENVNIQTTRTISEKREIVHGGQTPLHIAIEACSINIITYLLSLTKINMEIKDCVSGETALEYLLKQCSNKHIVKTNPYYAILLKMVIKKRERNFVLNSFVHYFVQD